MLNKIKVFFAGLFASIRNWIWPAPKIEEPVYFTGHTAPVRCPGIEPGWPNQSSPAQAPASPEVVPTLSSSDVVTRPTNCTGPTCVPKEYKYSHGPRRYDLKKDLNAPATQATSRQSRFTDEVDDTIPNIVTSAVTAFSEDSSRESDWSPTTPSTPNEPARETPHFTAGIRFDSPVELSAPSPSVGNSHSVSDSVSSSSSSDSSSSSSSYDSGSSGSDSGSSSSSFD